MVVQRDLLPVPLHAAASALSPPSLDSLTAPKRSRRRRAAQNGFINSWTLECLAATNWLFGKEGSPEFDKLSLAQREGVLDVRGRLASLGPPPVNSAAALNELRRNAPGYVEEPAKPVSVAVDSVALPQDDVKCNPGDHRLGDAGDLWRDWKARLLRPTDERKSTIRPHVEESLRRDRQIIVNY